jgi:uncharacterized protein
MKWFGGRESGNVSDRRGMSGGGLAIGGGVVGTIIFIIVKLFFGDAGTDVLNKVQNTGAQQEQTGVVEGRSAQEDEMAKFASTVLALNEDVWNKIFTENGKTYKEPTMVLFTGHTNSGCGSASSATGPFYCLADEQVYLDLSFFTDLKNRFGADGDFANAYVIAHEVGHHVQHLLGTSNKVRHVQQGLNETEANKYSVALELQADFYAGLWAHYTNEMNNNLEPGDIEEALNAANAIGDDRLQKMSTGEVVPDAFTHGTSEQRMFWFKKGYDSGDINKGDTFKGLGL